MYGATILTSTPGWAHGLRDRLLPGAHVVLFTNDETDAIAGRLAGLHLRDTLLILRPKTNGFAFLFRTPMSGSLIESAGQNGAGTFNIDACRIRWKTESERLSALPGSMPKASASVGTFQTRDRTSERPEEFQSPLGRWPTNVLIVHGPGCNLTGERQIAGHKGYPNGPGGSSTQFSQKGTQTTRTGAWAGHADAEGKETIPAWECEENCSARRLDELSGLLSNGGASRFYPQFRGETELIDWIRQLVTVPRMPTLA